LGVEPRLVGRRMDAVDGTDLGAARVLGADAVARDDVGHARPPRRRGVGTLDGSSSSRWPRKTSMDQHAAHDSGDPLTQPVRARAFACLTDLRRPATIEEIAGHLGLHHSGVRTHLARLEEDGLVERRTIRAGRGRPHYEWTVAPGARPGGRAPEAYGDLARWLA